MTSAAKAAARAAVQAVKLAPLDSAGSAPERVFIGLGGNVGDVAGALDAALKALDAVPGIAVVARSSRYRTAPIEALGGDYLNAVAELATTLEPEALLCALQQAEDAAGRRRPFRNAPRTLDLDLLLYGQRSIDTPSLQVPHPRLHVRAFALMPLLEMAPQLAHPALGVLADHAPGVADQAITRIG